MQHFVSCPPSRGPQGAPRPHGTTSSPRLHSQWGNQSCSRRKEPLHPSPLPPQGTGSCYWGERRRGPPGCCIGAGSESWSFLSGHACSAWLERCRPGSGSWVRSLIPGGGGKVRQAVLLQLQELLLVCQSWTVHVHLPQQT